MTWNFSVDKTKALRNPKPLPAVANKEFLYATGIVNVREEGPPLNGDAA
jgi:hypothetical protein